MTRKASLATSLLKNGYVKIKQGTSSSELKSVA